MTIATSTSIRVLLLGLLVFSSISAVAATHNDRITTGNDFDIPRYDTQWEIGTQLAAPFVFITLLLQITLNTTFAYTLGDEDKGEYRTITTIMALSITAMLVPSPFWDYVILASEALGLLAVTVLVVIFGLILYWVVSAEKRAQRRRRY